MQTQAFVAGVNPVVAENAVGYQVRLERVESGLSLVVTPRITDEGTRVRLTLQGQYSLLSGMDEISTPTTRPGEADAVATTVQTPRVARSTIDARASLPARQWTIVGSFGSGGEPPMHLLVRVVVAGNDE